VSSPAAAGVPGRRDLGRRDLGRRDLGSGSVLVLALLAVVAVLGPAAGLHGAAAVARHRAESAADLAALAAAASAPSGADCAAARRVADGQGADLLTCLLEPDGSVLVGVSVGGVATRAAGRPAVARARAGRPAPGVTTARADSARRVDRAGGRSGTAPGAGSD